MSILITIRRLVERLSPPPVCETCVADRLSLPLTDDKRAMLGELVLERGFGRERAHCALCDEDRAVILGRGRTK